MKLTNFTDYSLRTLMYLASSEKKICTAKEISQCFDISWNHMTRVVHNLSKNGYVESKKGKGGGISLIKDSSKIVVGDVIRNTEANFDIVECFSKEKNHCIISPSCELKLILSKAYHSFLDELDKYTLADITKNRNDLRKILNH